MDIGIIKPFKDRLRHLYHTWSAKNQEQRVNKCLVTEWVINAWNEVNPDIIKNSFRRIGIGEDLNVAEDDFLRNVLDLNSKKRRKKNIVKELEEHEKSLLPPENEYEKLSTKDKKFILRQIKDELGDDLDPSLGIRLNETLY